MEFFMAEMIGGLIIISCIVMLIFILVAPAIEKDDDGTPEDVCPYCLGLMDEADCRRDHDCFRCWSQPVEGGSEVHD